MRRSNDPRHERVGVEAQVDGIELLDTPENPVLTP
jgi:hypothetical protein